MDLGEANEMEKVPMPAYLTKFCMDLTICSGCIYQMDSFWQENHVFNVPEEIWASSSYAVRMRTVLFKLNSRTVNAQEI